ncbi:protein FAM204A [Engystomops pustulosus]|uniref:protein FAM204A n=1 Tax=Engystomops pustulosus TaxID=76066 RepID=UPI003AFB628C
MAMWSGLLPAGVTESDISSGEEEDGGGPGSTPQTPAVPERCVTKFLDLQRKRSALQSKTTKKRRKRRKVNPERPLEAQAAGESRAAASPSALHTLQKYFGANDHLEPPVCQKVMKKSRMEQNLDEALKTGDIEKAEELSDSLATREIAVKITKAAAYHRHMKAKEEPQSSWDSANKKKPVAWGFEAKKRWETKSNMGYM